MAKLLTQDFLEFSQIREGIMILKNNGLRAVLMVSSLNFALKSTDEQESIIYNFQNFLNSLDFSCQIVIQSRRLNMVGYLDKINQIGEKEKNELLKVQVQEYSKFVGELVSEGTIMQKSFYVVVPFSITESLGVSAGNILAPKKTAMTEEEFQRARTQLFQRMEFTALGLRSCGLQATPLNSMELTELLWALYHPLEAERGYYPEISPEILE